MVVHESNPADPAVMPTAIKKINSTRSLASGGIEFNIVERNIMRKQMEDRLLLYILIHMQM